jgi:hypothetical protein
MKLAMAHSSRSTDNKPDSSSANTSESSQSMHELVETVVQVLHDHHWWSFSLYKLIVALACVSGHHAQAITLIK